MVENLTRIHTSNGHRIGPTVTPMRKKSESALKLYFKT